MSAASWTSWDLPWVVPRLAIPYHGISRASWAPVPGKGHPWVHAVLESTGRGREPSVGANGLPEVKSGGLAGRKLSLGRPPPWGSQACFSPLQEGPLLASRRPLASDPS